MENAINNDVNKAGNDTTTGNGNAICAMDIENNARATDRIMRSWGNDTGELSIKNESDMNSDVEDDVDNSLDNTRVTELVYREFCVKSKGEESTHMTGIAVTKHDYKILICDHLTGTIKLVDRQFDIVFKYYSCFKPWDVAVLDAAFFVVTFPVVRLMQYFKFKESNSKFAPWFPVKAQNEYYGVCGLDDRIIAVCKYDGDNRKDIPGVHILNRQGIVLSIITKDPDGKQLFVDPEHLAINKATRIAYVSDLGAHAIVSINLDGDVLSVFSTKKFVPRGIAVDDSSNTVYVCDTQSQAIVCFSEDLEVTRKIRAKRESLSSILAAVYCIRTDRLIVSLTESFYLKTFVI